jgi:HEAT repeat protein
MLDQAFESLKTYDWGQDPEVLKPIDDAVVASHGDEAARAQLELQLVDALADDPTYDAKQYVCRQLMLIGSAKSVPTLASLLSDEKLSHMARYALERIPAPEAAQAMRDALSQLGGMLQVGVLASLGARQDEAAVPLAAKLLADGDPAVAQAAACALGAIRSPDAAAALKSSEANKAASAEVADAELACAEALLADGKAADAAAIYRGLAAGDRPKHVKLAATRGMLASAGRK